MHYPTQNQSFPLSALHLSACRPPANIGWYAVHLKSKHEHVVGDRLVTIGVEYYLPIHRSLRQWKDRKVWLESPLFPGYLFVRIKWVDKLKVVSLPGVISVLGTEATTVNEEALDRIKLAIKLGLTSPTKDIGIGERVRVIRGLFVGMEGLLVQKNQEAQLVVHLEAISQPFNLRISPDDVEPIRAISL